MILVYTAGPYRSSLGTRGVTQNIAAASEIAYALWQMGFAVICPHMNTAHFDGPAVDDSVWLTGCLEMVKRVDVVVMNPGWGESSGSRMERELALGLGKPTFYWDFPQDRDALAEMAARGTIDTTHGVPLLNLEWYAEREALLREIGTLHQRSAIDAEEERALRHVSDLCRLFFTASHVIQLAKDLQDSRITVYEYQLIDASDAVAWSCHIPIPHAPFRLTTADREHIRNNYAWPRFVTEHLLPASMAVADRQDALRAHVSACRAIAHPAPIPAL